jgi:hypothetical protein
MTHIQRRPQQARGWDEGTGHSQPGFNVLHPPGRRGFMAAPPFYVAKMSVPLMSTDDQAVAPLGGVAKVLRGAVPAVTHD